MYTKKQLKKHIEELGIQAHDTLLVHSSMKSLGKVEGGADAVLDAFSEFLEPGLLVMPTHTWERINESYNVFDVLLEPSCVGLLTNLFRQRPGVFRSWHPTHSVAALGDNAAEFVRGEEDIDTPCSRNGCWGKLYDLRAKALFLGVDLSRNTIIHGVEEWVHVPQRLTDGHTLFKIKTPDGRLLDRPMRRHSSPVSDLSGNYIKLTQPLLEREIAVQGKIGDATSILVDVAPMVELTMEFLERDPDLFLNQDPVPKEWY